MGESECIIELKDQWGIGKRFTLKRMLDGSLSISPMRREWVDLDEIRRMTPSDRNIDFIKALFKEWIKQP